MGKRLVVCAALWAGACGSGQKQPASPAPAEPAPAASSSGTLSNAAPAEATPAAAPRSDFDDAMAAMAKFRDEMCACKDAPCTQKVADEMTAWAQDMSKKMKDPPQLTEDQQKQAQQIGMTMGECMQRAMGASPSGGSAPPSP